MRNKIISHKYDDDGNQTLIKTETGIWSVTYNAENRPIRWESGDTVITMTFDRMGRRVEYQETRAGQVATHFRFVYDNFLCVQRLNAANGNAVRTEFVWDPTEPVATRPLAMRAKNWDLNLFYTHDGNKNVSEVFYHALQNGIAAHYDYAPFGAVTRTARATRVTNRNLLSENPFRFSSEVHDSTLGLVYYNYRHYNPQNGRWITRDPLASAITLKHEMSFCNNAGEGCVDALGLWMRWTHESMTIDAVRNAFSEKIACCGDSSENRATIEKLAKIISDANIATDTNEKYGENMAYHYNRGLRESPDEARMRYIMTQIIELYNLSKQLQIAFVSPRNRKKACTDSLDIIGRLAHMWQDYYAHGIDPTWLTVGSISGAPYFPSATPSSWGGLFWGGEHGGIGTFLFVGIWYGGAFEPGMRAPDRDERIKRSNEKTKFLMKYLLSAWMFTCGCEYFNSPTR